MWWWTSGQPPLTGSNGMLERSHIPVVTLHGSLPRRGHLIVVIHGLCNRQPSGSDKKELGRRHDGNAIRLSQGDRVRDPFFSFFLELMVRFFHQVISQGVTRGRPPGRPRRDATIISCISWQRPAAPRSPPSSSGSQP
jgi:hypothetical protein